MKQAKHSYQDSLVDPFSELLMLGTTLRKQKDLGDCQTLRTRLEHMILEADRVAIEKFSRETVNEAKFAVAAFLDEMILNSGWSQKADWVRMSLQYLFFKERNAGVEFFKRLAGFRKTLPFQSSVMEVYFYCLVLGFEGQHKLHDREQLKEILHDVGQELSRDGIGKRTLSSSGGKPPEELLEDVKSGLPIWIVALSSVSIVTLIWVVLSTLMNYEGLMLVEELKKIVPVEHP